MAASASLKLAKWGPHVAIAVVLLAAIGTGLAGSEFGVDVERFGTLVLLPVGLGAVSLALLYQAVFVFVKPRAGIQHDVEPPSKYDTSYETTGGARKVATLTALAGVFGLVVVWYVVTTVA